MESQTHVLKPDEIPLVTDGISQPAYYVDFIRGAIFAPDVLKLNFIDVRLDPKTDGVIARHVVTLITATSQIRAWAKFLNDVADQNGIPPLETATTSAIVTQDANG